MSDKDIRLLEEKMDNYFEDKGLLLLAVTHSSHVKHKEAYSKECNERLEFLGDGFFDAIIGEELYRRLPDSAEGALSKNRALIVCEDALYEIGSRYDLGDFIRLGKSEINSGGRVKESIVADAMEAIIGATYMDRGYEATKEFVLRVFSDRIERALAGKIIGDYKSTLQEELQHGGRVSIHYKVDRESGPDHDKFFYVSVYANGEKIGEGKGKSKKDAEHDAAKDALSRRKK